VSEDTSGLHRLILEADLESLQIALQNGAPADAAGRNGMTALMLAIASKDLQSAKLLVHYGADPELADDFNETALRYAVEADFADGVRFLLALGVDRGYRPKHPLKNINCQFSILDVDMPENLRKVMSESEWQDSLNETSKSLRESYENPMVEPVIASVQSVDILNLLIEAGDDVNLAPRDAKRALLKLETGGAIRATPEEYRVQKSPCFGRRNPERMNHTFWREMIASGVCAYAAREQFQDTDPFAQPGAVWCYDRLGSTLTPLKDGRYVQIGGEHEDFYDPDFFIYNDVVLHDGQGGFEIYGYPNDVFPPTDFHTATLCGDGIYIVGCVGYAEQRRPGYTPVYRLSLNSWEIEAVGTTGRMPGWIFKHRAHYKPERNVIRIAAGEVCVGEGPSINLPDDQYFELELSTLRWTKFNATPV
jgi:hypothetical protein